MHVPFTLLTTIYTGIPDPPVRFPKVLSMEEQDQTKFKVTFSEDLSYKIEAFFVRHNLVFYTFRAIKLILNRVC